MNVLDAPPQIQRLPRDVDMTPVPWGICWDGGRPRWDQISQQNLDRALAGYRCWTCGERLMLHSSTFVLSLRGALLRRSPYPPSHSTCASFIARRPLARVGPLAYLGPDEVVAVWQCREFKAVPDRVARRMVFEPGSANDVYWIKAGEAASRADVWDALAAADAECHPKEGLEEKARYEEHRRVLRRWLPNGA